MIDMPHERINRGRGIFGGEGTIVNASDKMKENAEEKM